MKGLLAPFLGGLGTAGAGAAAGKVATAGLGSLLGAGAAAPADGGLMGLLGGAGAGGALGLLSNPLVAMGVGSLLPQLMNKGGGRQASVGIPEATSDRQALPVRPMDVSFGPPNADLYRPGVDPEQSYFQGRYYSRGGPVQKYAGGGMLQSYASPSMMGYGPIRMQAGGIADLAQVDAGGAPPPEQRQALVTEAAKVIRGVSDADPRVVLGRFLAAFGREALDDLIRRVESGELDQIITRRAGKIEGSGDGMSDEVPGTIDGQQDVLLSDGEFVIPADVVSGLGNGSSDAGAKQLEAMMARVRSERTGTMRQAPQIEPQRAMPV